MFATDALNYFSGAYLFQEKGYTSGETLIKELSQHSPCKALIEEAQNVIQELRFPPLEVRIKPLNDEYNRFGAYQENNIIVIGSNLSASDQRNAFIFELTNVIQHNKHQVTFELAIKGVYKNPEEFARAAEFIEYNGLKRSNSVIRAINKQNGRFFRSYIDDPSRYIPVESMGFNLFYSLFLSNDHKEYYRKAWRRLHRTSENTCCTYFNNTLKIALGVSVIAIAFFKWG